MLHLRCARILVLLSTAACAWAPAQAQDPLPQAVTEAMRRIGLPAEALAAVALPLRHRDGAWAFQARRPTQPGSSMKVLTSVVALDRMGPNHRGFAELRSAAPLQAGSLRGDLVLLGGGDVELGVPQLWSLLLELQHAGVRHIEGDLVVDRTRYSPPRLDIGLPPLDEAPEYAYNVIPDALMLAEGLLPLELRATDGGVVAATVPPIEGIEIDRRMALVDARCADWDAHWLPALMQPAGGVTRITLQGAFSRGCTRRTRLQLIDRSELTERRFRTLWRGLGGSWSGRARGAAAAADTRLPARRSGRPWGELPRPLNKSSDNAWSRVLYLELGGPAMAGQPGRSTREPSEAAVRAWLAEQGIDDAGLVLDNGSGLSRSERISPWQMAQLLQAAHFGRHASELMMSLPTVGVGGSMRNRLKTGPDTGWARLKTGTQRNVVALAGYVNDGRGRPWVVAMMVNHDTLADQARPVLDALVDPVACSGPHSQPHPQPPGPQGDGP